MVIKIRNVPDFVRCIQRTHVAHRNTTWCGKIIEIGQFTFQSADHAAENGKQNGRLVACPDCATEVKKALDNGKEDIK